jgi:hypothetical protein
MRDYRQLVDVVKYFSQRFLSHFQKPLYTLVNGHHTLAASSDTEKIWTMVSSLGGLLPKYDPK